MKGDDGVGAVSSLMAHSGVGGVVGDAAGRWSVGPRVRAPPVNGDGLKVFAGCGVGCGFGGSRDAGYSVDSGTEGMGAISTVIFAALSKRIRSYHCVSQELDHLQTKSPRLTFSGTSCPFFSSQSSTLL